MHQNPFSEHTLLVIIVHSDLEKQTEWMRTNLTDVAPLRLQLWTVKVWNILLEYPIGQGASNVIAMETIRLFIRIEGHIYLGNVNVMKQIYVN